MFSHLIFILPVITLLLFLVNVFYKGNTVQSCLLFVLTFLPLMDLKITMEAWGGFKVFDFICLYCLLFLFKDFITINLRNGSNNNYYFVLFVALSIIILLGGLASEFPEKTYLNLIKYLPIFVFARFLMTEVYKDPSFHIKVIRALKVSYLTALVFILVQWAVGLKFTFYPELSPNTIDPVFHIPRYPGIFYDSQASGQFLAMGSFLFLYIEEGTSRRMAFLHYLVFFLAIIAINLAGSRSAFGGFAIGFVIALFMAAPKYRFYGALMLVIGYIIYSQISFHSAVLDRSQNISDDLLFRQSIWNQAFDISKNHPYLGIGSNNYQKYIMRHVQDQYLEVENGQLVYFDQPENGYLKIMVEFGFIGFAIFALFLITPLIKGAINYFKNVFDKRVGFLMAVLISWMVAFNTVYSIYDYRLLIMVTCMIVLIDTYPIQEYNVYEFAEEYEEYQV